MLFFGVFAIILNFVNAVPRILVWIYSWGDMVAWIIKITLIIVGGVLWLVGNNQEKSTLIKE